VLKTIEAAGKLTPELKKRIDDCISDTELEDIYLPYKPKRKTKATVAIEKGLEPLAQLIFTQAEEISEEKIKPFLNEQVKTEDEALQGARDIIAEWISENEQARTLVRSMFQESAIISSRVLSTKKEAEEAQKYRDYFDFKEPLAECPSHRLLAIRRGEKEGFLIMDISIEKESAIAALKEIFVKSSNQSGQHVATAVEDAYNRLLKPSIETEFRMSSKKSADEEAIRVFAENL